MTTKTCCTGQGRCPVCGGTYGSELMTIPTREEALEILDSIPSDYQQVDELKAWLRSYIESHTGEAWALSEDQYDGVRELIRNAYEQGCKDVDANYDPDDADPDFSEAAYCYTDSVTDDFIKLFPSIASPVQPDHSADAGKMVDPLSIGDK